MCDFQIQILLVHLFSKPNFFWYIWFSNPTFVGIWDFQISSDVKISTFVGSYNFQIQLFLVHVIFKPNFVCSCNFQIQLLLVYVIFKSNFCCYKWFSIPTLVGTSDKKIQTFVGKCDFQIQLFTLNHLCGFYANFDGLIWW